METKKRDVKATRVIAWVRAVVVILIFAIFAFAIVYGRELITNNNISVLLSTFETDDNQVNTDNSKIRFDSVANNTFSMYKNHLVNLSSIGGLQIFDLNGQKKQVISHSYTHPVIDVSDKYILHYQRNGKSLEVLNATTTILNLNYDNPILYAKSNNRGNIAVAIDVPKYSAEIKVYNEKFEEIYVNYQAVTKPLLMFDLDDARTNICVASIDSESAELSVVLTLFSYEAEKPVNSYTIENDVIFSLDYKKNGEIVAICGEKMIVFNSKLEKLFQYDYDKYKLQQFCDSDKTLTALVLSKYGTGQENIVLLFGESGNNLCTVNIENEVKHIDVKQDKIAVLSRTGLHIYDKTGKAIATKKVDTRSIFAYFTANADKVVVVEKTSATVVDF